MFRVLTSLGAIAALAVSAAPASAGLLSSPLGWATPDRAGRTLDIGAPELLDVHAGVVTNNNDPDKFSKAR